MLYQHETLTLIFLVVIFLLIHLIPIPPLHAAALARCLPPLLGDGDPHSRDDDTLKF